MMNKWNPPMIEWRHYKGDEGQFYEFPKNMKLAKLLKD